MKPHDQWTSADIADHARRTQLGRISMHVTDYGDEPRERPVPLAAIMALGVLGWLLIGWAVVKLWGMW